MPDYKADFHTHSILSADGGITLMQYKKIIDDGILDYIAITDHNEIDFALNAKAKLGERIIVGEEIKSMDGEIIGLFLRSKIVSGLSANETIKQIKNQGGIVYIPHPVNIKGVSLLNKKIVELEQEIDVIEFFNAKNFFDRVKNNAEKLQRRLNKPGAAGSDSHSFAELGRTYNIVNNRITNKNLPKLLSNANYSLSYIKPWHLINPKLNKIKKMIYG